MSQQDPLSLGLFAMAWNFARFAVNSRFAGHGMVVHLGGISRVAKGVPSTVAVRLQTRD